MEENTKVQVVADHKYHPGRIGFFQFEGTGPSKDCVMLSSLPDTFSGPQEFFVVGAGEFEVLPPDTERF